MQIRRKLAVAQCQHRLDHTGDARRRLTVTDVALHRPEVQRLAGPAVPAQYRPGGGELDGVAESRAGPVGLQVGDGRARDLGVGERRGDHCFLGAAARRGQPRRGAVGVDIAAVEHGEHLVAVAAGVDETLEYQHAASLGTDKPVGVGREGLAAPFRGEHVGAAHRDRAGGRGDDVDAARKRAVRLTLAQRADGQVQRDQGGRTGRVDGERRAAQPENVGDAAGGHVQGCAGAEVGVELLQPAAFE